jgi:hypothetical protein
MVQGVHSGSRFSMIGRAGTIGGRGWSGSWRRNGTLLKGRTLDALQVAASYGFIVGVLALGLVAALSSVTWLLERFIRLQHLGRRDR